MRVCVVYAEKEEDQMKSIISGKELDNHPVSTTLQHYVNILRNISAGTLRKERMEVNAGGRGQKTRKHVGREQQMREQEEMMDEKRNLKVEERQPCCSSIILD